MQHPLLFMHTVMLFLHAPRDMSGGTGPGLSISSPTQSPGFSLPSSFQRTPLPHSLGSFLYFSHYKKGPRLPGVCRLCVFMNNIHKYS